MRSATALLAGVFVVACSAQITPASPSFAPDPDTEALPVAPRAHIPDPRSPAPKAPPEAAEATATATATAEAKPVPPPDGPPKPKSDPEPAPKPAPKPAAAAAAAGAPECGSKDNPCPMQKLMRSVGAASTPDALEAAFNRIAALSPNAGWQWSAIAKRGAELAKSGDTATAKKQCKACHDQHRDAYKSQYRARKL